MSVHANPNQITDGLVFGYDTGYNVTGESLGVGRYFKGPISTNVLLGLTHSRSNTSGANGFVLNGEETVSIPTIGSRSVKYVEYFNNYNNTGDLSCCPNLFYYHSGYIGVESSTSYTYSIIYKHTGNYTHPNFMYRYEYQTDGTYNTEGGVHSTASSRRRHLGDGWYHAWGTFTTQSTTTQLRCYSFLYNYGTTKHRFYVASVSLIKNISGDTHLITPPQLMLKHNTSVSSTQSLIDLKRTTSIDVSNVSFDSNAQMTFDGTDDYIALPSDIRSIFTSYPNCMECVLKKSSSDQGDMVAFDVDITRWNLNYNMYVSNQWSFDFYDGTEHVIAAGNYDDEYVHFVLQQLSDGTMQIYANGVLKGSSAASNLAPNGSSIRIGSRSNGDSRYFNGYIPIMKIYNRALTSAEVASNFTAYKSRFQL